MLLKADKKAKWVVHELAIATAAIPTIILPLLYIFVPEYKDWHFSQSINEHRDKTIQRLYITLLVVVLVSMAVTKLVDRLCKMSIIGARGTIFFEGVDAASKAVAGVGSYLLFMSKESGVNWCDFASFGVILVALGLISYGDKLEKKKTKNIQQNDEVMLYKALDSDENEEDRFNSRDLTTFGEIVRSSFRLSRNSTAESILSNNHGGTW
jgi:hypothetical protein